jgi:hypothetical protein
VAVTPHEASRAGIKDVSTSTYSCRSRPRRHAPAPSGTNVVMSRTTWSGAGALRPGHGHQSPVDGRRIRQVADHVTDRDDRVDGRQRILRQDQLAYVHVRAERRPGQLDHGGRRVGRDDPVTGGQQVPGQRPGPAAELEHQPALHRGQYVQQTGHAAVGVLAEAARVHQGQVVLVVLHLSRPR